MNVEIHEDVKLSFRNIPVQTGHGSELQKLCKSVQFERYSIE